MAFGKIMGLPLKLKSKLTTLLKSPKGINILEKAKDSVEKTIQETTTIPEGTITATEATIHESLASLENNIPTNLRGENQIFVEKKEDGGYDLYNAKTGELIFKDAYTYHISRLNDEKLPVGIVKNIEGSGQKKIEKYYINPIDGKKISDKYKMVSEFTENKVAIVERNGTNENDTKRELQFIDNKFNPINIDGISTFDSIGKFLPNGAIYVAEAEGKKLILQAGNGRLRKLFDKSFSSETSIVLNSIKGGVFIATEGSGGKEKITFYNYLGKEIVLSIKTAMEHIGEEVVSWWPEYY